MANIDEDMARRVLASKPAVVASSFAGPKPHQYRSVVVDFCAKTDIVMLTMIGTIDECRGKEGENRGAI
jgi:hypothetical protein